MVLLAEEPPPELPYVVEHLQAGAASNPKVLGRSANLEVAMAMFEAAARDHPAGVVLLKRGERVLRRSGRG